MRFRNWLSILLIGCSITGCRDEEPVYQLTDEQMSTILADIHISESAAQHLPVVERDSMVAIYLEQILEIHETDRTVFETDYEQLKMDSERLETVYDLVLKRIAELKNEKAGPDLERLDG